MVGKLTISASFTIAVFMTSGTQAGVPQVPAVQCAVDQFDDGVIAPTMWLVGGEQRGVCGVGCGPYVFFHQEIMVPDGHLETRVQGPATGGTEGGEAWVRTLQDFNDGKDYVINFTWSSTVNANHMDGMGIQITDGTVATTPEIAWWYSSPAIYGYANLYYTVSDLGIPPPHDGGMQNTLPTTWSIRINATHNTAQLYFGPDLTGTLHSTVTLDPTKSWHFRLIQSDASSSGFPGTDNTLNIHSFSAVGVPPVQCSADTNANGVVNIDDLVDVLNAFGLCPAP